MAARISRDPKGCGVALIGLADDLGVRLNNGRSGAIEGPTAFRAALAGYGVADPFGPAYPGAFDAGDIVPAEGSDACALDETHRRVTEATRAILDLGLFPIAIGGGHDLTFPFVRAAIQKLGPMSGCYFDAHLDVRDAPGSGMPFRRLIEDCGVRSLRVYGSSDIVNSREHVEWFTSHGGVRLTKSPRSRETNEDSFEQDFPGGNQFVSLDLDVIDSAFAPGVSAMNPCGWSPGFAEKWVDAAGLCPRVRCFDIMELNPRVDPSGRTARLAAHLFLTFVRAFAERGR
jgi:arginase family enzyme